jgi:hypothetical protein
MKTIEALIPAPTAQATPVVGKPKSLRKGKAAQITAAAPAEDSAWPFPTTAKELLKTETKPEVKTLSPSSIKAKNTAKPKVQEKVKDTAPVAVETFTPRLMTKGQPIFALDELRRPGSGAMLFAHTHAVLTILGMLDAARPAVSKSALLTMIGKSAVNHHTKKDNLESAPDNKIRLSVTGYNFFKARVSENKFSSNVASAYQSAILDGTPSDLTSPKVTKASLYQVSFG